ncbi:MAG: septum site-determining protein MinC [Zoogloeaceae bacterium]|jgi:septum site-determining protein MinC|nr:septum site-determining protein MinC [Zoogloeaceae bacterium]
MNSTPIAFKGSTLTVILINLQTLCLLELTEAAQTLFGENDFFEGDAGVLNLARMRNTCHDDLQSPQAEPDWQGVRALFAQYGLNVIGVCGSDAEIRDSARKAGLAVFPNMSGGGARRAAIAPPPAQPELPPPEPFEPAPASRRTLLMDRPLRSGQRVHAHDSDLVVTAIVNPGAEVIADGNIHIYAPLRGRALAGASGDIEARVFATCFEAELIAIAGSYLTFANGVPPELNKQPVQASLETADSKPRLTRLKLD